MVQWAPRPPFNVTIEIGQGCGFPNHLFTAPQFLLHKNWTYEDAIRQTILIAGGPDLSLTLLLLL